MALAVARTVEHETWSWPDPEVGLHPALRGLGVFASLVGISFAIAWGLSQLGAEEGLRWVLMVAALGAGLTAVVSLVASVFSRRASQRKAPRSVRVGRQALLWARCRMEWEDVRSIGIGERLVERGRAVTCVVVRDRSGREVWLGVEQPDDALEQLDRVLRDAWREAAGGGAGPRLTLLHGGGA